MNTQGVLREMLDREVKHQYGPKAEIAIDEERGVWVKGLEGQAVAATTLRGLAERLGAATQPLSGPAAYRMFGLVGSAYNLARFVKRHAIPCTHNGHRGSPLLLYKHEVARWLEKNHHDPEGYRVKARHRSAGQKRRHERANGSAPAPVQAVAAPRGKQVWSGVANSTITHLNRMAKELAVPGLFEPEAAAQFIVDAGIEALRAKMKR